MHTDLDHSSYLYPNEHTWRGVDLDPSHQNNVRHIVDHAALGTWFGLVWFGLA